jgi:ribosomal protein L7/L12
MEISAEKVSDIIGLCKIVVAESCSQDARERAFDFALDLTKKSFGPSGKTVTLSSGEKVFIPQNTLMAVSEVMKGGITHKIEAIKVLRYAVNMGLKDAKDCVESPKVFHNALTQSHYENHEILPDRILAVVES